MWYNLTKQAGDGVLPVPAPDRPARRSAMSQHTREVDAVETILGEALGALHVDPNGYYRHLAQACVEAAQGVRNASVSDIVGQAILGPDFEPINPRRKQEAWDDALGQGRN